MACTGCVVTVSRWSEDQRSTVSTAGTVPKAAVQMMSFAGVLIGWLLIGED
jgi:hypothetical protein